jgi:hypothetical protein
MATSESVPDVLDLMGVAISEVGSAHIGVEWARRWPTGSARVAVVLQAAYSGALLVDLALNASNGSLGQRQVALSHGEVRRVRFPFEASEALMAAPLTLLVKAPVPAGASRIRPVWLRQDSAADGAQAGGSMFGALFGAVKQAVGVRPKKGQPMAPSSRELAIALVAAEGEMPIAAEEEAVWQPGMDVPKESQLIAQPSASASTNASAPRVTEGERPECPSCHGRFYLELIRAGMRCPSCGQPWNV